ncbi:MULTISPECIES: hypothetical protein [unclassified Brevundimonas]|uniref:hypothetical protein n=1 Tax=unclassified Brevundimonas TaxID=2622653 RepID=UPI000AD42057|nr:MULTISPECIES: hypothetical protein [unclassified Brevundimonas]
MKRWVSLYSIAAGMAGALLVACVATPSFAQLGSAPMGAGDGRSSGVAEAAGPYLESVTAPIRSVTPSRLRNLERREFEAEDLERRRLEMDDGRIRADIDAQLEQAGIVCGVRGFRRVGTTPDAQSIYEAACGNGPGYVVINGVEPRATSCLVLAGGAASALRRDPNATVGAQCTLPENQNGPQVIGAWAREAGVACRVDQAEWLGPNEAGFDVYEVGCDGTEGYWLEKAASGWSLAGCLQVSAEGQSCRFTAPGEQHAWMRARLAGTPAEGCDVAEIRMIGVSALGRHYETRCRAPGQGFVVRIEREGQAADVTPCTEAEDCALTLAARSEG